MRRIEFSERNRSGNLLHIEVPGAIVNIRVNLHDHEGRQVTSIEIVPDEYAESGGRWRVDGYRNTRVIQLRDDEPTDRDELARLFKLAQDGDLEPGDLDGAVRDAASMQTRAEQHGTLADQLRFLLDSAGAKKTERAIQDAVDALSQPHESDNYVTLDRGRYYVSLGGANGISPDSQPRNGYPDPQVAIYELAKLMAERGEFRAAWMEGEHGPSSRSIDDEVRAFHDTGGDQLLPLDGVQYEPGDEVRSNDGTWEVICDYGTLGVWLGVAGDRTAGERFTEHSLIERADLMSEARGWIADCQLYRPDTDVADLSDFQVKRSVEHYYEGGWAQFTTDFSADPGSGS